MKLLIIFVILNIVNVILQTVKSIATVKCGKSLAALINAVAYGLYTVVIVYTNCELSLIAKVVVVAVTNLIGVYVVKLFEEKARKDKLWKVEATAKDVDTALKIMNELKRAKISCNAVSTSERYAIVNAYCETQNDSLTAKEILTKYGAKYFVSETKTL